MSPVIASVILAGVVLSIGGMIWSYSLGAASVTAAIYVNDTLDMLDEMNERFDIEHATYDSSNDELTVWIYNYGEVDVVADVYATLDALTIKIALSNDLPAGITTEIPIDFSSDPLSPQDQVAIKVNSRRQNVAYYTYYVQ